MNNRTLVALQAMVGALSWASFAQATDRTYSYPAAICQPEDSYTNGQQQTGYGYLLEYVDGGIRNSYNPANAPMDQVACPIVKHSEFSHISSVSINMDEYSDFQTCYVASGSADGTDINFAPISVSSQGVGTIAAELIGYDYYWIHCYRMQAKFNLELGTAIWGLQITESDG